MFRIFLLNHYELIYNNNNNNNNSDNNNNNNLLELFVEATFDSIKLQHIVWPRESIVLKSKKLKNVIISLFYR